MNATQARSEITCAIPVRRGKPPRDTPREILRRRFAASEMTSDEYERCKALLDRDTSIPR